MVRIIFLFLLVASCSQPRDRQSFTFQEVESASSGIDFVNTVREDVSNRQNLLDFDYFYNGAGVGAADLDGDNLPELFFCGNQVANRLYQNKGELKFEDVTAQAMINVGHQWSNGITFADVNSDGLLDIYVSQGGPYEASQRKNLLFLNQGDLTFSERAEEFGLADQGISTHSAFFDYDQDGDLDCLVMNESELYGRDPATFYRSHLEDPQTYYHSISHLYRNDGGTFTDVTVAAGLAAPTFGLGLAIADINNDGWPDIYLANDYYVPDQLYINRRNGTFSDRAHVHLDQMSFYGMGVDVADLDANGAQDIYVADMASKDHVRAKTLMASMDVESFDLLVKGLGLPHQYMFNSLQVNDGMGRFSNQAHFAGVAQTDWSWAPLIEDFDLDTDQDLFVTNGYRRYALDNDFKAKVTQAKIEHQGQVPLAVKKELYGQMPSEALPNLYFENQGDMPMVERAQQVGLGRPTFSNGAVGADLDRDGDLDVVINNIDQEALVYRNLAQESGAHWIAISFAASHQDVLPKVTLWYDGRLQMREVRRTRGYMSACEPIAYFGLGEVDRIDSLFVEVQGQRHRIGNGWKANQVVHISAEDLETSAPPPRPGRSVLRPIPPQALGLQFVHQENDFNDFAKEVLLPQKQSTLGPLVAKGDATGDGRTDLFIGGAAGQSGALYVQQGDGAFVSVSPSTWNEDAHFEDLGAVFFDVDQDGDQDLYVVSGGNAFPAGDSRYEDRLYLNNGQGQYRRSGQRFSARASGKVVRALDLEGDGDQDLLIGNRIIPQQYPLAASSVLPHQ